MRSVRLSFSLVVAFTIGLVSHSLFAQGAGYWHTSGSRILDANNRQVRIAGINWYGFETTDAVVHGLTSQDYVVMLKMMKTQGFNTVRLPFSSQMIETPSTTLPISFNNSSGPINSDLAGLDSLHVLDKIITAAGQVGLKVILDNHRSEAGDSAEASGLWYTPSYPESAWIKDWTMLANRYMGNPTVIGFDLRNEPHNATSGGACWDCGGATDWHLAAQRAGNAVLAVNPQLLVFVEGTDAYNNDFYWWGGNLEGVAASPVTLSVAHQLVYEAHDYGPHEYAQSWFTNDTYASLSAVWSKHWGYISQNGIAPVWLGEFGTTNNDADISGTVTGSEGLWFSSLVTYLSNDADLNWTYWALNGEDTYGYMAADYGSAASIAKTLALQTIEFPLNDLPAVSIPAAPTGLTAKAASTSAITLSWTASSKAGVTYSVYMGSSASTLPTLVATGVASTTTQVTELSAATSYYFDVVAANAAGTSTPSNIATATTQGTASPSPGQVVLGNLNSTFDGTPHAATVSTVPSGLAVTVLYNGSTTAPSTAGNYNVTATINDAAYTGSASASMMIAKASAILTVSSAPATYDGQAHAATVVTNPAGLTVGLTYSGAATAPVNAGTYSVAAAITDPNYDGAATGTLVIAKQSAVITLGGLSAQYDTSAHAATAVTVPAGLSVAFTYAGSSAAPTEPGSYPVVATINDPNYAGSASGALIISPGKATLICGSLNVAYDGQGHPASFTTSPAGLAVNATYNGTSSLPLAVGTYVVSASINDPRYTGSGTGTLFIYRGQATVAITDASLPYDGTSHRLQVSTTPAGLSTSVTYNDSLVAPTAVGSYKVVATVTDPNFVGTGSATLAITGIPVAVSMSGLSTIFNGSPQPASVTTTPSGLPVNVSYNGSSIVPVSPGTYQVAATVTSPGYTGTASGSMVIRQAMPVLSLHSSITSAAPGQSITFTTTITSSMLTQPTGTISLLDNGTALTTMLISGGMASTTLKLAPNATHLITAIYAGDSNFSSATDVTGGVTVTVAPLTFTFNPDTLTAESVKLGGIATYTFSLAPLPYSAYPSDVVITIGDLPKGASATVSPAHVTALGGPQTVTLTVTAPSNISDVLNASISDHRSGTQLALLTILPMVLLGWRKRRFHSRLLLVMFLTISGMGFAGLAGCSGGLGSVATKKISVLATAGGQQHSGEVTMTIVD